MRRPFQSTRPVWGATYIDHVVFSIIYVSIHAPRVGRDSFLLLSLLCSDRFNPRAPCGARRLRSLSRSLLTRFQSTRPVWGATDAVAWDSVFIRSFNPRAPCGARRHPQGRSCFRDTVSIHAPRVGRDKCAELTIPMAFPVSIHAPRVGRDPVSMISR